MTNNELFDLKVERFLKKQMTPEEEESFKKELSGDPSKLERAKAIALAIRTMKGHQKSSDEDVQKQIKKSDESDLESIANGKYWEEFDDKVERFLKKQMTMNEEKDFFDLLKSSAILESRAKTIALAVRQIRNNQRTKDQEVIRSIKHIEIETFKNNIGLKEPAAAAQVIHFVRYISIAASIAIVFGIGITRYHTSEITSLGKEYSTIARATSDPDIEHTVANITDLINNNDSLSVAQEIIVKFAAQYPDEEQTVATLKWNLALAYIKEGEGREAQNILNDIVLNHPEMPIAEKAKELIEKIEYIYWFNF